MRSSGSEFWDLVLHDASPEVNHMPSHPFIKTSYIVQSVMVSHQRQVPTVDRKVKGVHGANE